MEIANYDTNTEGLRRRTTSKKRESDNESPQWVEDFKTNLKKKFFVGFDRGTINEDAHTYRMNGFTGSIDTLAKMQTERVDIAINEDQIYVIFYVNKKRSKIQVDPISIVLLLLTLITLIALIAFIYLNLEHYM